MLNSGHILDDKYEIIKVLGKGGMGTVYLCKNSRLGNLWAVKEVISQWKNQIDFLAEPNMLKNLSHAGIVRIVDIFHEDDNLYIVEDYIEGKTLKELVDAGGPLSSEAVREISLQLCSILDYLHSFNPPIVYRDLKPSNIMIKPGNKVVLIDFGIARTYKDDQENDTMILGSMGYIAPEQLTNAQSNSQTDIYSLGSTMFFMLTGKAKSLAADIMIDGNYPEPTPKRLIEIVQKASAVEPERRYSDAKQMISELNAITADGEYDRTMLMSSNELSGEVDKTVPLESVKSKKKAKSIPIPLLAGMIALVILMALLMGGNPFKKAPESAAAPAKEVAEQDTVVKGILDVTNPVILDSGDAKSKGKGKGKNNDNNVQFVLNPAASVSNSKVSVSLTDIESVDQDIIAVLTIQNIGDPSLKLDLSKTFLVNGVGESKEVNNPDAITMMPIPQGSEGQELRFSFRDFQFKGDSFTLKTVLSSAVNKDISLEVDIAGAAND